MATRSARRRSSSRLAIARRRIKTGGGIKASLALIPITKPIYALYGALVQERYPHLVL